MQYITVEALWRNAAGDLTDTATGRVAYLDYKTRTGHDEIILSFCVDAENGREEPVVLLFGHDEIPLSRALATFAELQRMLAEPVIAALARALSP